MGFLIHFPLKNNVTIRFLCLITIQ